MADKTEEKKQELKDFSLNAEVLINELSDQEISQLFSPTKPVSEKKENPVNQRFVEAAIKESQRGRTENLAATFNTADDPRIDFFFKVFDDASKETTIDLLEKSWDFNCLDTLRMIAYLRDIRDGKGVKGQYYHCLYWLYVNHPQTLLRNLNALLNYGYWRDLLYLLIIILFNGKIQNHLCDYVPNIRKKVAVKFKKFIYNRTQFKLPPEQRSKYRSKFFTGTISDLNELLVKHYKDEINKMYKPVLEKERKNELHELDEDSINSFQTNESVTKPINELSVRDRKAWEIDSKHMKELIFRYARERFNGDAKYRYFHLKIAEIFAKQLIEDVNKLKNNEVAISLAAKWAPSLNGHYDRYMLMGSSIALQIAKLTRAQDPSVEEIFTKPIVIATYLARKNYHKNYITKLREHIVLPETYMCKNQWNLLPYDRVPSKCMFINSENFLAHDKERFKKYIESKNSIKGSTLQPHLLVQKALDDPEESEELKMILEKQWVSLKNSIQTSKEACFNSALCVCDVSGSMYGTPLLAAIGLTLMTMESINEPWCNICVTFSEKPEFIHLKDSDSFYQRVKKLKESSAGLNTDLSKTFKLILEMATRNKLKPEEMPKYLFVFTDMEFDKVCDSEETNFEEAKRLFSQAGYLLPTVIFWNLRCSNSIPVQKTEHGTILVSGYSAQQLKLLMNSNIEDISPILLLEQMLTIEKYDDLVVVD